MMTTKYLPVEGEKKEGDTVFDGFTHVTIPRTHDAVAYIYSSTWQLVKLFLISDDIQVGDKVWQDDHIILKSISKLISKEERKFLASKDIPDKLRWYKVIGEIITPGITEGLEVEDRDWKHLGIDDETGNKLVNVRLKGETWKLRLHKPE